MSKGTWRPETCPDGHREDAPLEAALLDEIGALLGVAGELEVTVARLRTVTRKFGGLSRLVREVERLGKGKTGGEDHAAIEALAS